MDRRGNGLGSTELDADVTMLITGYQLLYLDNNHSPFIDKTWPHYLYMPPLLCCTPHFCSVQCRYVSPCTHFHVLTLISVLCNEDCGFLFWSLRNLLALQCQVYSWLSSKIQPLKSILTWSNDSIYCQFWYHKYQGGLQEAVTVHDLQGGDWDKHLVSEHYEMTTPDSGRMWVETMCTFAQLR